MDLNDALKGVIQRTTGDVIEDGAQEDHDRELLFAMLKVLTLMSERLLNQDIPKNVTTPEAAGGVVPFVS